LRGVAVAIVALVGVAFSAASCIEPRELTPDIAGDILALEVEGQTRAPVVNAATRTISIELGERVDLKTVRVTAIKLVETAVCDVAAGSVLDLSSPLKVIVRTAVDYEWTVTATNFFDPRKPLPGGDFEQWHRADRISAGGAPNPEGKVWNPWAAEAIYGDTRWWDTGNDGVTLLRPSISTPTEPGEGCPDNPEGIAARLETIYAAVKVAGGNIYFGRFGGLDGMDAKCEMGHPWQTRPKALKGWYKYFPQKIDRVGAKAYLNLHPYGPDFEWIGKMDSLHVSVTLWASPDGADIPFTVNTNPNRYVDITPRSEGVIAWGSFISGAEQADWAEFNVELEYFTDAPLPPNTRLIVQATPSKHCNYFIAGCSGGGPDGKTGSLMYVDEFELVY
jgi:hypothetical protein